MVDSATTSGSTSATTTAGDRAGRLPDALRLGPTRLRVTDVARSAEFYERVVGLQPLSVVDGLASLGTSDGVAVLELEEQADARPAGRHAGLYHVALLYPTREELARVIVRIATTRTAIQGASDHGTHEAIYLADPDGIGLELAADRPREQWPANLDDIEEIRPRPLDVEALVDLVRDEPPVAHAATGLSVGHLHLHVGNIAAGADFYTDVVGFDQMMRMDVAVFVASGGYHHHLGMNTWQGVGVGPAPAGTVGLRWWTAYVPDAADVDALAARLEAAGSDVERLPSGGIALRDPWQHELRVEVDPDAT
ncbi:MAG: Glyoxalase/bleomycin resistance protein/dioxygenase [Thermoleophilia bacterium]|nr:Glyoxalase/bleomycin resistance protein/dioxygenase [Thermoleophilia bacterium]